ncbi:MAG: metallophosphoesterase [Chloroflexi bacterium]|nr:metallophosphoesterase [Chloroflexota bacterium]
MSATRRLASALATAATLSALLAAYAVYVEPYRLVRRRRRLEVVGLPPALTGLTILHVSDFHLSHRDSRRISQIERALATEADLVALTGDFIANDDAIPVLIDLFRRVRSRYGAFGVLGNHDHRSIPFSLGLAKELLIRSGVPLARPNDVAHLMEAAAAVGITVLNNDHRSVTIRGESIYVLGVDDPYRHRPDLERARRGVPAGAFELLLAHSPDIWPEACAAGIPLTLAGHTHGGQIRVPFYGPLTTRTRATLAQPAGLMRSGDCLLHVSTGLGASFPARFAVPPESTLLELVPGGTQMEPR